MSMPPDIDSAKLFSEIIQIPRQTRLVPLPINDPETGEPIGEVCVQILTQHESMQVAAAAEKTTREYLKGSVPNKDEQAKGYNDLYNNAAAIELLFRACRNPENPKKPFFPTKNSIGEVFTSDQISILLNHYFTVQVELGQVVGSMSSEEIEAWIVKLQEGGSSSQYFLNLLSWEALKELMIATVLRLQNLQTCISSPSLPQEDIQNQENK